MGCSGAAFTTTIDAVAWDPLACQPLDDATQRRAARAAGVRLDPVPPPFDDDMRALVLDRIVEAIDAKVPPLVRGIKGPPDFGLIVGYDDEAPTFYCRTYFDMDDDPTKVDWTAFRDELHGMPVFLDRAERPERAALVREGLDVAGAAAEATDEAFAAWTAALRDDARWSDARHAGAAAVADHLMRAVLIDKRRAAARFLRSVRSLFPNAPGGDLLRAAESYGYAADAAAKGGTGPAEGAVATRFLDAGQRRAWARLLDVALAADREARAALASARAAMR